MSQAIAFERDDTLYLVTPVVPVKMETAAIDELAFSASLKSDAPNSQLVWLKGQYVEADRPNANGALWLSDDLAVKSLTPKLMPVTVMHDPKTAVGLIADTKLLMRDEAAGVPRTRIDTVLALWGHRFPEVVAEVATNYEAGTLCQSMECHVPHYECGECGQRYAKLPGGAERENWCAHLRGETAAAGTPPLRRLLDVTFSGTGLIFGTRGAVGALDSAALSIFEDEVAEFHQHQRASPRKPTIKRSRNSMEIEDKRYEELIAAEAKLKDTESKLDKAEIEVAKVPDLERKFEAAEVARTAAEAKLTEEQAKRTALEETARAATLASERTSKLGAKFTAKLPASIKTRLDEQAKTLDDTAWGERLDELAELIGVKADDATPVTPSGEFTADELAASDLAARDGGAGAPTPQARRSVLSGLLAPPAKTTT